MVGQELIIYPWFYWYTQSPKYTVLIVVPRMYIYIHSPCRTWKSCFPKCVLSVCPELYIANIADMCIYIYMYLFLVISKCICIY